MVAILAILGTIALPAVGSDTLEATASTLMSNVTHVGMVLEYRRQERADGSWPEMLETSWFVGQQMPPHPERPLGVPLVEVVDKPGVQHPRTLTLTDSSPGAYWYNSAEGAFRARVVTKGTTAETQTFYHRVNQTNGMTTPASSPGPRKRTPTGGITPRF